MGEMSASIFSSAAQASWPSSRQRQNFTALAGTNDCGTALLCAAANILSRPFRFASGAAMKKLTDEPSWFSR